jgi:two-component system, OmpR family, KDP operon response regulator KdpE
MGPQTSLMLIVDDDPAVLKLLDLGLELEGFRTITAVDGRSAIRQVHHRRPALVLLDVMMPVMDGLETCKRIREFSEVPIIMLTAKNSKDDVVRGLDAGADDYITKPFDMDELVARARAVLHRMKPTQEVSRAVFQSGALCIDFASGRVLMDNTEIPLPPTEYRALVLLARNAGRVVTYEELLTEVWDGGYGVDIHVMHVAIARLRKRLGNEYANGNPIANRSSLGYTLRTHGTAMCGPKGGCPSVLTSGVS